MDGSDKNVFLTAVVPAFGALISLLMYASPVFAVLNAAKVKALGDLNPIPFAVTVANTIVWATYGLIKHDPFVTAPNATGVVVAVFCMLTCFGIADDKLRGQIRLLICAEAGILAFLGVLTSFATNTLTEQLGIWGLAGNVICLVYYASPLGTMAEVIKTRNSASILLPMTVMNTANAALWTTYGLAMADVWIWLPNGLGLILSILQLGLAMLFPSRPKSSTSLATTSALHEASYTRLTHGVHSDEEHLSGGKA